MGEDARPLEGQKGSEVARTSIRGDDLRAAISNGLRRGAIAGVINALVLISFVLGAGCASIRHGFARPPVVLSDPPPVSFFPMETAAVEHAIVGGMARLKWMAAREAPGVIRGTLHLRTHTVVVHVEYTTDSYRISYVDSENMEYCNANCRRPTGVPMIHPNYNSWVRNLVREINSRLVPPAPGAKDFP